MMALLLQINIIASRRGAYRASARYRAMHHLFAPIFRRRAARACRMLALVNCRRLNVSSIKARRRRSIVPDKRRRAACWLNN